MNSRAQIFKNVLQANKAVEDSRKAPLPDWDKKEVLSRVTQNEKSDWKLFAQRLEALHGVYLDGTPALVEFLKGESVKKGYCSPALLDTLKPALEASGITLGTEITKETVDEFGFGITEASGAIAESGSVVLEDNGSYSRLGALAPWIHIAVVRERQLMDSIPQAFENLSSASSIVIVTGPSKTADIEGILIEGVHGPGIQAVCFLPD